MRMIESNTGRKPDGSVGDMMIQAWRKRYPQAAEFGEYMESIVLEPGYWRSLSGRVRHFALATLDEVKEYDHRRKSSLRSGLSRQARNFPEQELVAATTAKALVLFTRERDQLQLASRVGLLLYDAMTAFSLLEQVRPTADLLRSCLTERCRWKAKGGEFNFEVDTSIGFRWGVKPNKKEKALIESFMQKT